METKNSKALKYTTYNSLTVTNTEKVLKVAKSHYTWIALQEGNRSYWDSSNSYFLMTAISIYLISSSVINSLANLSFRSLYSYSCVNF